MTEDDVIIIFEFDNHVEGLVFESELEAIAYAIENDLENEAMCLIYKENEVKHVKDLNPKDFMDVKDMTLKEELPYLNSEFI